MESRAWKIIEGILKDNQLSSLSSTDNSTPFKEGSSTPSTIFSTDNWVTRSSDTYIYVVEITAVIAIDTCVFSA